jgi:acyl-CoA reductase-like NAD-dependent aldehyde dehydrogenase
MNFACAPAGLFGVGQNGDADVSVLVAAAMAAARAAQVRWARTPLAQRIRQIREVRHLIAECSMQLASASASARARPVAESLTAEVLPLAEACRFLEREAKRVLSPRRLGRRGLPLWLVGVRGEIHREPLGVVLIVGPGNFPLLLPGTQLLQALVAGNAVLLKPGVGGTPAALALRDLLVRAGFDPQLVALLPETPDAVRAAIAALPDKVLFTGSAAIGGLLLAQLAPHLIPSTMELSGCDAVIVRSDADLDLTAKALEFGLRLNGGATCLAPKRVFVARSVATELEGRLARTFNSHISRGHKAQTSARMDQSHLTSAAAEKLRPLLDEALAGGAHLLAGEMRDDGAILLPLVLAGVSPAARLLREDVFAPVLALVTTADDHEAILQANDCPFALGASIFTRDDSAARALAGRLDAGVITINDLIVPTADARIPFGGRKRSGFGVTRGAEGLLELTRPKVVTLSRGRYRPAFEPPNLADQGLFEAYLGFAHGRSSLRRIRSLLDLFKSIFNRINHTPQATS